jgi:hypothetical protein
MKNQKIKLGFDMNSKLLTLAALFSFTVPAIAQDNILETQDTLSAKLDSAAASQWGVNVFGRIQGGMFSSKIGGNVKNPFIANIENRAYTRGDISIEGRPSQEGVALVEFRVHQDWNRAYDEGPNLFQVRQMYFGGLFNNKKVRFRVGDIFTKKSPLMLWSPELSDPIFETQIFANKRKENMDEKLIGNHNRPLQGFDFGYKITDAFEINALVSRVRAPAWNTGIFSITNATTDKYYGYGDLSYGNNGVKFGAGASWLLDRVKSTRSMYTQQNSLEIKYLESIAKAGGVEGIYYEDNSLINVNGSYDSRTKNPQNPLQFFAGLDYVQSKYRVTKETLKNFYIKDPTDSTKVTQINTDYALMNTDPDFRNLVLSEAPEDKLDGSAINVRIAADYNMGRQQFGMNAVGIQNSNKFVNMMAQSATFNMRPVLNAANTPKGVVSMFDALYNATFQIDAITQRTSLEINPIDNVKNYNGTNNWLRAPYEKTPWKNSVSSKNEMDKANENGPSVTSLAFLGIMPAGQATANRSGLNLDLNGSFMDAALDVKGVLAQFNEAAATVNTTVANENFDKAKMQKVGLGALLHMNSMIDFSRKLDLSGSFATTSWKQAYSTAAEEAYRAKSHIDLKADHMQAGLVAEVLPKLSLLAGYQSVKGSNNSYVTTLGNENTAIVETQTIVSAGLSYAVSPASAVLLDYTKITYATDSKTNKISTNWVTPRLMYNLTF